MEGGWRVDLRDCFDLTRLDTKSVMSVQLKCEQVASIYSQQPHLKGHTSLIADSTRRGLGLEASGNPTCLLTC